MPVHEIWGVGRRLSAQLNAMGITTALELTNQNPKDIRQKFSVVLERTVRELNGESCLALEDITPTKQQILCSHQFWSASYPLHRHAGSHVNGYVARAEKLRYEQQQCQLISVYIRTGLFNPNDPRYSNSASLRLDYPTDDTRVLLHTSPGACCKPSGKTPSLRQSRHHTQRLYDRRAVQPDLFYPAGDQPKQRKINAGGRPH